MFDSIRAFLRGDDLRAADYLPAIPSPSPLALRSQFDPSRQFEPMVRRAADWSTVESLPKLLDAVRKSVIVFACASYLADAVAEAPLLVYRLKQGDKQEDDSRPGKLARSVLANPNPYMSETEFWALIVYQMAIQGYGVVEKARAGNGLPVQLWPLRPDWLKRADNGSDWRYKVPLQAERPIPDDDLIIIPYRHDDRMERLGISPAIIAAREIGVDGALTDFLKVFLDSGGIPPFVMTSPDPITDESLIEAVQAKWRQKYGGAKAYGSLPVLHGGWDLKQIGGNLNEMAWPDLRGLTELKIAQAFRVPADLIEARDTLKGGSLTTTEADGAMAKLQRYGAQPLRVRIDGAMTRGLLREFVGDDPTYDLAFDTSNILALQEDTDQLHTRVRADWESGLIMLDEARNAIGEPVLPNKQGQVFKVAFTTMFVPAGSLAGTSSAPALPVRSQRPRYRHRKALSSGELELRANVLQQTQRDRQRLSEIGARKLRQFWKEQGQRVVSELAKSGPSFDVKVADAIDWDEEERLLAEVLKRYYVANGEAAYGVASATIGVDLTWSVTNPNIQRLLNDLGLRIRGINETTRLDVVKAITDAQAEGASIPQIAERISGLFEQTYKGRAETVARTETQVSYNRAAVLAYQESGQVAEAELVDNPAHDTDPGSDGLTCAQRDGLTVPLGDVARHVAAEHPRGSLAVLPVLSVALGDE